MLNNSKSSYLSGSSKQRALAFIIDELILFLPTYIIVCLSSTIRNGPILMFQTLLITLLKISYHIIMLNCCQATLGKKFMKLKVVNINYQKPSFGQILLRETAGKWLSAISVNLGYLWLIIDRKHQGWHDKLAKTLVVTVDASGNLISGTNTSSKVKSRTAFVALFFLWALPPSLFFIIFFYLFIGQPYQMKGSSMMPNIPGNQHFLAKNLLNNKKSLKRGDIVIFNSLLDPQIKYVKRIIGLPGEQIKIENGQVYINYQLLEESYLPKNTRTSVLPGNTIFREGISIEIPKNSYFVMGDNRPYSSDSRDMGFIPEENIIGIYWLRYF